MNRVRLLPDHVANQIAAGEVVERPASVVKELVENGLDAGPTRISIETQAGGRSLVRVTDDGSGMSRDDALLCLERHATSKISRAEDLAAVATMGFRGEALPSIASVSRFTLTTRERASESPEGTQVVVSGGRILEVKAAGTAPGTTVEVRQLFFNLPARRKFLRSEETESAHIQHYLTLAALAHPEIGFTFLKDGRQVWQLAPVPSRPDVAGRLAALRERMRALNGQQPQLLEVNFAGEISTVEWIDNAGGGTPQDQAAPHITRLALWGLIGAPGVSRATREEQHLFVNRRPVENRGLNFALLEGYHTALMKGRYPVACLFLEIDPAAVDVNIHPAKREVKFHRENDVKRCVAQAIREALLHFHSAAGAPRPPHTAAAPRPGEPPQAPVPGAGPAPAERPFALSPRAPSPTAHQPALRMGFRPAGAVEPPPAPKPRAEGEAPLPKSDDAERPLVSPGTEPAGPDAKAENRGAQAAVPLLNVPLRLVGVIGRLYVVLESDRGLVLLDQHAAHERILFEQMLSRLQQHQEAPSQKLLLPETIEVSAQDAVFLREHLAELTRLGVGLNEFGERTFLLDALPPFVKVSDPRGFVLELVDELKAAGQQVNSLRLGEQTVAKTVCRHAVKAHDPLAGPELEKLIEDLRHCAMPYTCPHGRPTLIEMNFRELEKKFGRLV